MNLPETPSSRLDGKRALVAAASSGLGLTDLTRSTVTQPDTRAWVQDMIQLRRSGEVEGKTRPMTHLATDATAPVTGTALMIDAGWTAE